MAKKVRLHLSDDLCLSLPLVEDALAYEMKEWINRTFDIVIIYSNNIHKDKRFLVYDMDISDTTGVIAGKEPPAYLCSRSEDVSVSFAKPIQRVWAEEYPDADPILTMGRLIVVMDIPERCGVLHADHARESKS